jgi:hypothetical protein
MKNIIKKMANKLGIEIRRFPSPDISSGCNADVINKAMPYTMTSVERVSSLCDAVRYVAANKIPGDIVECGVWKGGSMLAAALTLVKLNDRTRNIYLFDTFEGMTVPGENDIYDGGKSASGLLRKADKKNKSSAWCCVSLEEVQKIMFSSSYDEDKIHFVKGRVEETIPRYAPQAISILRLDTDFYESTRHELEHLFNRISSGGVLIIDDYGSWEGARRAVDEFMQKNRVKILMNRIDYSGRIGIIVKD